MLTLGAVGSPSAGADGGARPLRQRAQADPPPTGARVGGATAVAQDPARQRRSEHGYWYMYCTSDPLERPGHRPRRGADLPPAADDAQPRPGALEVRRLRAARQAELGPAPPPKLWGQRRGLLQHLQALLHDLCESPTRSTGSAARLRLHQGPRDRRRDPAPPPTGPWRMGSIRWSGPSGSARAARSARRSTPTCWAQSIGRTGVLYAGGFQGKNLRPADRPVEVLHAAHRLLAPGHHRPALRGRRRGQPRRLLLPVRLLRQLLHRPASGYGVFARRSPPVRPVPGPGGQPAHRSRVGGAPVLAPNGNRWVGGGHNTVFRDFGGQWWTVYHAIDKFKPFFANRPGFTKRPPMLDPVDWVGGWPTVRSGHGASVEWGGAPAAQPRQRSKYRPTPVPVRHARRPGGGGQRRVRRHRARPALDLGAPAGRPATYSVSGGTLNLPPRPAGSPAGPTARRC